MAKWVLGILFSDSLSLVSARPNRDLFDFGLLLLGQFQLEGQRQDAVLQLRHGIALDVLGQAKLPLERAVGQLTDVILVLALVAVGLAGPRDFQNAFRQNLDIDLVGRVARNRVFTTRWPSFVV